MASSDNSHGDYFFAKEKEFRRLNEELEQRRRDLTKEILDAGSAVSTSQPTVVPIDQSLSFRKSALAQEEDSQEVKPVQRRREPTSASQAVTTFLNAKIGMLQTELENIRQEYRKKSDDCKELEHERNTFEEQKARLHGQIETLKENIAKCQNDRAEGELRTLALRNENTALKKELDSLQRKVKTLQQESDNREMRLNRTVDENERLRNSLKYSHIEERELRDQMRNVQQENRVAITRFGKQRLELVHAFKKQTLLVDNLKKQNAYLLMLGHTRLTQLQFAKLMDGKLDNLR